MVKVLRYKSESCWFKSSWCQWKFYWHNTYNRTVALGSSLPQTKLYTRSTFSWQTRSVRKADKLIQSWAIITLFWNLRFVEASWHLWPVMGLIYLSQALRSRFAFLRLLGSLFWMCFLHGYSSLFGVVCLSVRCLRPADHPSKVFLLETYVWLFYFA